MDGHVLSSVLASLMAASIPLGPNRLMTIRGRKSGMPRTKGLHPAEAAEDRRVFELWPTSQTG
jgi:hypothetical protein